MKLVYLCSRFLFEHKVDRHRATLADAIARLPGCSVTVTGHGWPDYDSDRTVASNLETLGISPDVLWVYQQANDYLHRAVRSVDATRIMLLYDCYATEKRTAEVEAVEPHIVFHTHANDAGRLTEFAPRAKHVHVPFGVDRLTFWREGYGERPIDCLVVGQTHEEFYPLRARWRRLVASGRIPGEIRPMPAYRLKPADCMFQYSDWAAHMRRAKIVLTGSSKWRYPLQVFYAAAMAGCLVCADRPRDPFYQKTLGRHQMVVAPSQSDAALASGITHMLRSPDTIRRIAEAAKGVALEKYTTNKMAEQLIEACRSA